MSRIIPGYNERVVEEQIRAVVERMNHAWLEGTIEDLPAALDECFHPAIVIRGGDLQAHGVGKEACIQSYLDFLESAAIHKCLIEPPEIDVAGDSAIAIYGWEMTYETDGQTFTESGSDILALARNEGRWLITWRAMLPSIVED
jgi:ketosteroid isomerase-like protein